MKIRMWTKDEMSKKKQSEGLNKESDREWERTGEMLLYVLL